MIYSMNSTIGFGKHKGKTPTSIVACGDANYLCWLKMYFEQQGGKDAFADDVLQVIEKNYKQNPGLKRSLESKFSKGSADPASAISAALSKRADQIDAFGQQVQVYAEDFGSF